MPQNNNGGLDSNKPSMTRKDIKAGETSIKKKYWRVGAKDGKKLEFFPIFEVNGETGDTEARYVEILTDGKYSVVMNWLDLFMFVYFVANEELRRNLAARYERNVNMIPYDVTIKVSPEEAKSGIAKRRVELPVDELTMAIARNEAWKMFLGQKSKDPRSFQYKKPRST